MNRKVGSHRLSLGRQEEDLVSEIRQHPGPGVSISLRLLEPFSPGPKSALQSLAGLHGSSALAMARGASQAGLTATAPPKGARDTPPSFTVTDFEH